MEEQPQTAEQLRQRLEAMGERIRRMREQIEAFPPIDPVALRRLLPILLTRTYHVPPPEPKPRAEKKRRSRTGPHKKRLQPKEDQQEKPFDWVLHRFSRVD